MPDEPATLSGMKPGALPFPEGERSRFAIGEVKTTRLAG
jgi:hypothetical protein